MNPCGDKNLLMVTFFWPPSIGSGVWRPLKFAKYLPQCGWRPSVVTALKPGESTEADLSRHGVDPVEVHHVPPGGARTVGRVLDRLVRPLTKLAGKPGDVIEQSLAWRSTAWCSFPDPGTNCNKWIFTLADKTVQLARTGRYDAIYVTSPPDSLAITAAIVASNTRVPVIIDFRDPWTQYFAYEYTGWRDSLARRLERWCIRGAARAVAVTPMQLQMLQQRYPDMADKMACITNGFDAEDIPAPWNDTDGSRFVLSLLGVTYDVPDPLFEAIRRCCDRDETFARQFRLRWIGAPERAGQLVERLSLHDQVDLLPRLPQAEAMATASRSHALWLEVPVQPGAEYVVRGKMFDYLGLGLPILGTVAPEACSRAMVERAGACWFAPSRQVEDIAQLLDDGLRMWRDGELSVRLDAQYVSTFRRDNLARDLAALLDEVVHQQRGGGA